MPGNELMSCQANLGTERMSYDAELLSSAFYYSFSGVSAAPVTATHCLRGFQLRNHFIGVFDAVAARRRFSMGFAGRIDLPAAAASRNCRSTCRCLRGSLARSAPGGLFLR
jgi:hypothetical protein